MEAFMKQVFASCSASISELKKNPTALLNEADGAPVAILHHNKPTAYLIPADTYEWMMDILDDYELGKVVKKRRKGVGSAVAVELDDL